MNFIHNTKIQKTIMVTKDLQKKVIEALAAKRANFAGSDSRFAVSIGINNAQYSRLKNGETDRLLSDAAWITLARKLEVTMGNFKEWKVANTPVYEFITGQLRFCQDNHTSRLMCDIPDIGKTFTAKQYVKQNRNAVYVDCSQVKTRQKMVRYIAKEFGVGYTGYLANVYADLVYYLRTLPNPLIILDEAGDLEYDAFLELKALWNATERTCGWYMMGADGLKEKIRRSIDMKRVGYTEIFSRYGSRYQKVSPDGTEDMKEFKMVHAAMIIKANVSDSLNGQGSPNSMADMQKLIIRSDYSLRRIEDEIRKQNY
jgi:hypothetical protein